MNKGFTLVELLITLVITLLIGGAVAQAVPAARIAFDRIPTQLEMTQRGRTAIDALTQAVRAADHISVADPDADGRYLTLNAVTPVTHGGVAILSVDQGAPGDSLTLAATSCPDIKDLCGFTAGAIAMITDHAGAFDVFIVKAISASLRRLTPDRQLSHAYPSGSLVVEVQDDTFGLFEQPDGSYSLIRTTAAGAVQPIADFIASLAFAVDGGRIDIDITVQAQAEVMRRVVADRIFRTSIAARNVS